ncbi:MAG: cyclase family protein [Deltaproteobacteria bacterium]|nr:cyclase family protein [Deltaproteobacteria bacterium]
MAAGAFLASRADAAPLRGRIVDLTHAFGAQTIYWPTEATGFVLSPERAGVTEEGYYYASNALAAPEHGGTHLDAPLHFWAEGESVDAVPLERLIGPGVVIDVRAAVAASRDHQVSVDDLLAWERAHGLIPPGAIVLLHTGFGAHWPDRRRYLGTEERGEAAVAQLHFPGLLPHAAAWLADTRKVHAVGLDTASIDYGQSKRFESHVALFRRGVPAFENVANLERLPAKGFTVIALPMKIAGGSGAPLRIVAVLDGPGSVKK